MNWAWDVPALPGTGCPIRRPPDQSLLAAPRGISSLATSFLGCNDQSIHRKPFVASPPILRPGYEPENWKSNGVDSGYWLSIPYSVFKVFGPLFVARA